MRVAFKTFGCRANSVDTDAMWQEARKRGYLIVPETEAADFYIINSCTVTENADRDTHRQVRKFKRLNPAAKVGVVGCYAQMGTQKILEDVGVDYVVGTSDKLKILDFISTDAQNRDQVSKATGFLPLNFLGSKNARAPLKIQDGCNYRCSFCIIPQARGRSVSLPLENVLNQYEEARNLGYQEVVLTGIHLAHYGWDKGTTLLELIKCLLSIPGPRIRLSTLDPFEIEDELVSLLAHEPKLCPFVHIALQSGSDRILRLMRRVYVAEEFKVITKKLAAASKDIFIGVDIIVGFPGETDEDFALTLDILKNSFWAKLHVFPYSERVGTDAAQLSDSVDPKVRQERSQTLRDLSQIRQREFFESQVGKQKQLLIEKRSKRQPDYWTGHTENYLSVLFAGTATPKELITITVPPFGEPVEFPKGATSLPGPKSIQRASDTFWARK